MERRGEENQAIKQKSSCPFIESQAQPINAIITSFFVRDGHIDLVAGLPGTWMLVTPRTAENVNKQRASRTVHTLLAKKRSHGIAH